MVVKAEVLYWDLWVVIYLVIVLSVLMMLNSMASTDSMASTEVNKYKHQGSIVFLTEEWQQFSCVVYLCWVGLIFSRNIEVMIVCAI